MTFDSEGYMCKAKSTNLRSILALIFISLRNILKVKKEPQSLCNLNFGMIQQEWSSIRNPLCRMVFGGLMIWKSYPLQTFFLRISKVIFVIDIILHSLWLKIKRVGDVICVSLGSDTCWRSGLTFLI